jgi:hypothetical protein
VSVTLARIDAGYLYSRRCKFCGYVTEGAMAFRPRFVVCAECSNVTAVPPENVVKREFVVTEASGDAFRVGDIVTLPEKPRGQTRTGSAIEVATNILVGFSINWVANLLILPLYGFQITGGQAFSMGLIFTAIAIVRGYVLRRVFNRIRSLHHE